MSGRRLIEEVTCQLIPIWLCSMKVAAALAAQEDDEDEDGDGEELDGRPAVPPLPNGRAS